MNTRICRYFNSVKGLNRLQVRRGEARYAYNQNHDKLLIWYALKHSFLLFFSFVFLVALFIDGECQANDKELVLGVRADAPPFSSFDSQAGETPFQARGYTVDLCNRIAKRAVQKGLYCSCKYKRVEAADRFVALKNHEINMLCGASTVTLERMRAADFSLFTFLSGASVMYRINNARKNDAKNEPLRVGVLKETTTEREVKRIITEFQRENDIFEISAAGNVRLQPVEDHYQGLEELRKDKIDAYVADREILLALRQKDILDGHNTDLVVSEDYYTVEPYAIGIEIGNSELRYIANSVLSELYDWNQTGKWNAHENIFTVLTINFPRKKFSKSLEELFRLQRIAKGNRILGPILQQHCN